MFLEFCDLYVSLSLFYPSFYVTFSFISYPLLWLTVIQLIVQGSGFYVGAPPSVRVDYLVWLFSEMNLFVCDRRTSKKVRHSQYWGPDPTLHRRYLIHWDYQKHKWSEVLRKWRIQESNVSILSNKFLHLLCVKSLRVLDLSLLLICLLTLEIREGSEWRRT